MQNFSTNNFINAKKDKSVPYTEKEKLLLASLVDKHNIVENKRTNAATIQKKQEWDEIALEFNAQGNLIGCKRNAQQLKKLWSNLKQRKRKSTTALKYERLLTGGGPEPVENPDPVMEAVNVAAPHMDVSLPCPWDTTAAFEYLMAGKSESHTTPQTALIIETEQDFGAAEVLISPALSSGTSAGSFGNNTSTAVAINANRNKLRGGGVTSIVNMEANLRVTKMQQAIKQQEELHMLKMQVESANLEIALSCKRKADAEKELAELQLQQFKEKNV